MLLTSPSISSETNQDIPDAMSRARESSGKEASTEPLVRLLAATAKGDRVAFAEIYSLTSSKLLGIAVKMIGNRDLAKEVLQETFLSIWQRAGKYSPELGQPMAWLTTLVRHRSIDRLRSMGASREVSLGDDGEVEVLFADSLAMNEAGMVIGQTILKCLQKLNEKPRNFILLAFYYGFTHQEVSDRTQTPLGTVKSGVKRGLSDLKVCLER